MIQNTYIFLMSIQQNQYKHFYLFQISNIPGFQCTEDTFIKPEIKIHNLYKNLICIGETFIDHHLTQVGSSGDIIYVQ